MSEDSAQFPNPDEQVAEQQNPQVEEPTTIPQEIGEEAYENTAGEAVIVPAGCEMIGRYAFRNSQNLRYIRIPEKTVIAPDAFEECVCVVIDQYADQ